MRTANPRKPTTGAAALADANSLEARFLRRWEDFMGPPLEREYRFHPVRKWRLDFAYPARRVGVEIHGATYVNGRHVRGKGFTEDRRKMNYAQFFGWKVFELTAEMLDDGDSIPLVIAACGSIPDLLRPASVVAATPPEGRGQA